MCPSVSSAIDEEGSRRGVGVACRRHNGIRPVRQGFDRSTLFGDCDRTSMAWRSLFNAVAKWVNALANRVNAIDPYGIRRHPKNKFVIVNILDL